MADRIEQEIEEILAKIDGMPGDGERKPIPIVGRRRRRPNPLKRLARPLRSLPDRISPATLLLFGAATMVAGLLLANAWEPAIWASFAGILIFISAFLWSFLRSPRAAKPTPPEGHFWRDRYIRYEPASQGPLDRVKRRLRRK